MARSIAAALAGLVLLSSGWGWHLVQVAEASVSRTNALPASGNADVNGANHAGAEMNLLLVGMDSRTGLTAQQQQEFSTGNPDEVLNTDSMMLVHVPADGSAASFVSLPRDTYVSIPGFGDARLNSAYSRGYNAAQGSDVDKDAAGAQLLIQTVSQFTGLRIDHFAEIDLLGFINLSELVGGVEVNLCRATRDSFSGANFPAGVQTISGADALKFVRQRHGLPHWDLDRVVRQQVYIAGMLRNILSSDLLLDPTKQQDVVEQIGSSITFDQGLDIFDLAAQMQNLQLGNITFQTVPGLTDARINGADVLRPPSQDVLNTFFASLTAPPVGEPTAASTTAAPTTAPAAPTLSPSQVKVTVLNGSGVDGAAASGAAALIALGFNAGVGGNAPPAATTTVRAPAAYGAAAALVATRVPGAAVVVDDSVPAGTVSVVIGSQYGGIATAASPTPAAPATSSAPATQERTATDTSCIY
jgi:LCP family protein required for cell wall assembly